jgi:hypothetical protein
VKRPLTKLPTEFFDPPLLILGLCPTFILSSQKVKTAFLNMRSRSVLSIVQFTLPSFLLFSFHGASELRTQTMVELLSMNQHRAPRIDRWTIHGAVHSVTDRQYCRNFPGFYLKVNYSTPVFMSHYIIMCN